MTTTILWRLFLVACAVTLLLGALVWWQAYRNGELSDQYHETKNYYELQNDSLRAEVNEKGQQTVYRPIVTVSPATLASLEAGIAARLRDDLRAEFRGQNAKLLFGQNAATTTQQQLPTVALTDTVVRRPKPGGGVVVKQAKAGTFKDEWLNLTGIVTDDSMSVKYTIRNEFDVRAYSKRDAKHWWQFWKPRRVYVDLKNKNPNTTTDKMEAVLVDKK
ncbi:hypothetical protein DNI29_04525 [Hymenobacter sediminis]|uniref:DUF6549 family protein n=1 Tax=Hymenobacter sediminis TaxID=2218621 RepID=UPI000DA6D158|nr:DUF6549 family protein [Hymenobacter sediminis]RPD50068.1 hypothetical protein DNI29_04525 [Hymenobacter sediminis]